LYLFKFKLHQENGELYSWGGNKFGQLGIGRSKNHYVPYEMKHLKVKQYQCSVNHSIILNEDGIVASCGNNFSGQLGLGDNLPRNKLTKLVLVNFKVVKIACGGYFSYLLSENYDAYSFGDNSCGQLGLNHTTNVNRPSKLDGKYKDVVCGYFHVFLIDLKSNYFACGSNEYFNLFLGHKRNQLSPAPIKIFKKRIKKIFAGNGNSFFLDNDNFLFAIGRGEFGQLGFEPDEETSSETLIMCPSGRFTNLNIGGYHCLASTSTGKLFSFGDNRKGQLAIGKNLENSYVPLEIKIPEEFASFWCGMQQSFLLSISGHVYSCGYNENGALGIGEIANICLNMFTKIESLEKIVPFQQINLIWLIFRTLAIGHVKNSKCVWSKVPLDIIKTICKYF